MYAFYWFFVFCCVNNSVSTGKVQHTCNACTRTTRDSSYLQVPRALLTPALCKKSILYTYNKQDSNINYLHAVDLTIHVTVLV